MRKIAYIASLVIEIAALVGMWVLDYFARAKLGMNRWLVYNNKKWEASLHPDTLGIVIVAVLLVLLVAAVVLYVKRKDNHPLKRASLICSILIVIFFASFSLLPDTSDYRALYLMELLLAIASFIQLGRTLIMMPKTLTIKIGRDESELSADELKMRRTSTIARWATIIVLVLFIEACVVIMPLNEEVTYLIDLLSSGDINAVAKQISSYGAGAAFVSFLLMILQSLAAPIPAFLITFANAAVFGWWQGAILSWTSAMVGATVCFYIARALGRDAVAHFVTGGALKTIDQFFEKYGSNTILICRLLPFMSFDYVSYAAGLTGMKFRDFIIATGVGQLPATIVYSYVGGMLTGSAQMVMTALLILFALAALVFLIRQVYTARNPKLMDEGK